MKKKALPLLGVSLSVILLMGGMWFARVPDRRAESEQVTGAVSQENSKNDEVKNPSRSARSAQVKLSPELIAEVEREVEQAQKMPAPGDKARDGYYERLLAKQGRDHAKEAEILSRLSDAFGGRTDASVGTVACSPEFCRVEMIGSGKVDVHEQWEASIFSAVEPQGFRFFVVAEDEKGNTLASCYFGRDASWTVPDFHALGML